VIDDLFCTTHPYRRKSGNVPSEIAGQAASFKSVVSVNACLQQSAIRGAIESAAMGGDPRLLGLWETDSADATTVEQYGRVRLHFFESGDLTYTICSDAVDQVMRLTYLVEGNTITTQQPSAPRQEKTQYAIEPDGRLALTHDGIVSRYRRIA